MNEISFYLMEYSPEFLRWNLLVIFISKFLPVSPSPSLPYFHCVHYLPYTTCHYVPCFSQYGGVSRLIQANFHLKSEIFKETIKRYLLFPLASILLFRLKG